jgi:hypothetical protein
MTASAYPRRDSTVPRRVTPELCEEHAHRKAEGAGNAGRALHPWPPVQQESTGVSNQGHTAIVRHSLRDGFNGLLRALPGDRALLPPSPARRVSVFASLAPASGRQDHTASPSARSAARPRKEIAHSTPRPPQSRSAFVTIAIRPSGERNGTNETTDLGYSGSDIFFAAGLDDPNHVEIAWKISFLAQGVRRLPTSWTMRHAFQFTTINPGTRSNSPTLAVTSVRPLRRACAAIRTS